LNGGSYAWSVSACTDLTTLSIIVTFGAVRLGGGLKSQLLAEVIDRPQQAGWFSTSRASQPVEKLVEEAQAIEPFGRFANHPPAIARRRVFAGR